MSQTELTKALDASRVAFRHPLVLGIALTSNSPTQALKHAQNRGLSKEEQTWCRLLAKSFKIARELGMDALSILPHEITRKDDDNMPSMTFEIKTHLAVLKTLVEEHRCAGDEYYEDSWIEVVKDILALNKMFREEIYHFDDDKERRDFFLNFVFNFIVEGENSDAILLLIGDDDIEVKKILLNCITSPRIRKFFYTNEFEGKYITDVSDVRKQTIGPFMALFAEHVDEIFGGDDKCSVNLRFADYFFLYYGMKPYRKEEDEIVFVARDLVQKLQGIDIFVDKDLATTLYRAMVFDTVPGASSLAEIKSDDIVEAVKELRRKEHGYSYYAVLPNEARILINYPFLEGDDVFLIISDPEKTLERFDLLAIKADEEYARKSEPASKKPHRKDNSTPGPRLFQSLS